MLRVGLTGGIASGKTAASDRLAELGALVIDADLLAREVVAPGTPGLAAVAERFGPSVLVDGSLDRAALASQVFSDVRARRDLESIIHPAVRARAEAIEAGAVEAGAPETALVVHVIPLLVETGQEEDFDLVVVVDLDPETQRERLQSRNGLTDAEADARLAAQASRAQRLAVADHVLDNSGTPASLQSQVDELWHTLLERSRR